MSRSAEPGRPKVGVVVLNYRNHEDTAACLDSLHAVTYPELDVVVVDNDSRNASLDRIAAALDQQGRVFARMEEDGIAGCVRRAEPVLLLQAVENRGYAAGNNLGIRCALLRGADLILILNNDTVVDPGFLEPLVAYLESHPDVAAAGPRIVGTDGRLEPSCVRRRPSLGYYLLGVGVVGMLWRNNPWNKRRLYLGEYDFAEPRRVDVLSGSCMLLRRAVFEQTGLLDENTFLYFEELILHEKLRRLGWRQAIVPEGVVVHKGGMATSELDPSRLRESGRESLRYYLMQYRNCSRILTRIILLSLRVPIWLRMAVNRISRTGGRG